MERPKRPPRVLFFGMQGNFSLPSLRALVESGVEVCAVVVPAPNTTATDSPALYHLERPRSAYYTRPLVPMLAAIHSASILQLAWTRSMPLWEVARLSDPETVMTLAAYQPDIVCVSCFSQRIPRAILEMPRLGCLNVHPSLLPENRGPVPLFWTFRMGSEQTGVTIHLMDEGMDSGDILAQSIVPVPAGISYAELESRCSYLGGALLSQVVWELFQEQAVRIPQVEVPSSYHSFPSVENYDVPVAEWSAAHVYNFIRGIGTWGEPIRLHIDDAIYEVQQAFSYSHENTYKQGNKAYVTEENVLWLRCKTGWVGVLPTSRLA